MVTNAQSQPKTSHAIARVCFTGRLASMSRRRAAALVREAGGKVTTTVSRRTSMLVVGMNGWPVLEDGTISRKLQRAETLIGQGAPIRIVSETVFRETIGVASATPATPKQYSFEQVCGTLDLPPASVRRWEMLGLIRSDDGQYDFQDILSLRAIAELTARGVPTTRIAASVRGLASVLPDTDRPLAQLTLVERSGALLAEVEGVLLAPDGQLVLDFDPAVAATPDEPDQEPASLPIAEFVAAGPRNADGWFEHAVACEEEESFDEAAESYRKVLAESPRYPEAHFNLGNVLRALGRPEAAEEHFRLAVDQDPALAEGWYNLADMQEEQGQLEAAVASLRSAVAIAPAYADAHYNLALCLERLERDAEAAGHWRSYLDLDREGPWATRARAHLAELAARSDPTR
ncbi:MAG: tetratricopeptide repeat protein [Phycisphaerales bacterium]|nr:tetratricopeptide repeat protein [Phycisphaerales bacterium]